MATVRVCSKLKTTWKSFNCFYKKDGNNSRYFVAVFDKTIIPLAFVGYEKIGAYLQERISSENESPLLKYL